MWVTVSVGPYLDGFSDFGHAKLYIFSVILITESSDNIHASIKQIISCRLGPDGLVDLS